MPVVSLCVERSILKKTERSETTLRHSTFDILRFDTAELVAGCGSLLM